MGLERAKLPYTIIWASVPCSHARSAPTSPDLRVSWEPRCWGGPPGGIRRPGGGWRESSSYIGRLGSQVACVPRPDPPPRETTNSRPLNTQEAQLKLHQAVFGSSQLYDLNKYFSLFFAFFSLIVTIIYQYSEQKKNIYINL